MGGTSSACARRPQRGQVRAYQQPAHSVYVAYDNITEKQNFFFPDKPNYVGKDSWKLI
jgi:hypothetical protein